MKTGPAILVLIGIALLAFLYFSPVTPSVVPQQQAEQQPTNSTSEQELTPDAQVEDALRKMQSGELPPMEAIIKIREVADNNPGNVKANFTLGQMSMQTGQYDKAVQRFETVLKEQPGDATIMRLLAEAQMRSGDTAAARSTFAQALEKAEPGEREQYLTELPELK